MKDQRSFYFNALTLEAAVNSVASDGRWVAPKWDGLRPEVDFSQANTNASANRQHQQITTDRKSRKVIPELAT
ncbi:MAG: hypothetical protein AAGG55_06990 [Pseudomonadota bacterium]